MSLAYRAASLLLIVALGAAPVGAQRRGNGPPLQTGQRALLLQQIHQQFMKQARNRMALTPEQFPRFQRVVVQHAQRRAPLELEEDRLRIALGEQIRLRGAGNQDSTARLLDAIKVNQAKLAAADADQMHDLEPILTPVQRAQWQVMQERFRQQVRMAAHQRADSAATPQP